MNPQIRFGEDLMSRVSYAMLHEGGAEAMTRAVREAIASLVRGLATRAEIELEDILEITIVGNPIMHHLFLGIDPTPLGSAPFALATDDAVRATARELEIPGNAGARVYVLPCIAGHVGADAAGAILAETPYDADEVTLLVDVGTNAEIVLGSRERLLAASSPTGPAFEGAQISCGQRAAPGAIERVRIDKDSLEPRFRVIGSARWSDETGFDASTRRTGVTGVCGSGIVEVLAELFLAGVITADGTIDGSLAARTPRIVPDGRTFSYVLNEGGPGASLGDGEVGPASPRLLITQNDVRAIQLAKAALYAGARLLMDHLGVETVDRVKLAGAFGSQIDPLHALILGLVPDAPLDRVGAAGNAAGTGALIALLSGDARREIERVVRTVEKIETAIEPRFQAHFVDAMAFPHATAPSPNLAREVDLPARPGRASDGGADSGATGRSILEPPTESAARRVPADRRRPMIDSPTESRGGPDDGARGRPGGGRAARHAQRAAAAHAHGAPFLTRSLKPYEVLDEEGLSLIEHNADTILEEVGIIFRGDPAALETLEGCRRRRRGRARQVPARACAARSSRRARRGRTPSMRGTRSGPSRSATRTRSSRRTTARPSFATSTTGGATGRSRISGTS